MTSNVLEPASRGVGLAPVLQPIVSLNNEAVVGFEALARWPELDDPTPEAVFDHASAAGRLSDLDDQCTRAAVQTALAQNLPPGTVLAINCEPQSSRPAAATTRLLRQSRDRLRIMFELTERGLLSHPRDLLAKVAALRAAGFTIALDDVGANPDSLALLDIVSPDVVKLDLGLVQTHPDRARTQTLAAVWAFHERTGAVILAEGIETGHHLEQARALGATLGQGYRFSDLQMSSKSPTRWAPPPNRRPRLTLKAPSDVLDGILISRSARKPILTAFSRHIEEQAATTSDPPIVLAALQHARYVTASTRKRYELLARTAPLVAVFGQEVAPELGGNVRGVALESDDPTNAEWTVIALGPQLAVALVAREHCHGIKPRADSDRRFEFAITYDRTIVTAAAQSLLNRMLR